MKIYLSIKYYKDFRNRKIVDCLTTILGNQSIDTACIIRDYENNGNIVLHPDELMKITFEEIKSCDILLIDLTEKGVGVGIEAGFAYAGNIPIIVIARNGSDISGTLQGIAKTIIFYDEIENLEDRLINEINKLPGNS